MGQFFDIGRLADVRETIHFVPPMELPIAQTDGCALSVDVFLQSNDAPVGGSNTKAEMIFVGQVNHHRNLGIIEVQLVGSRVKPKMLVDGIAFIGAFLVEQHFQSHVHPTRDGNQGTGADMHARLAETVAFVAVHLADIAAKYQLALDDLGMEQGRSGQ